MKDVEWSSGIFRWWSSWRPTSRSLLKSTEAKILACIQNDVGCMFVTLPNRDRIWTVKVTHKTRRASKNAARTPLVLLHGVGGGVGLWILNLDTLSHSRTVYALDLLGFGRSSRPSFPADGAEAEQQFVSSIEQWRERVGLERMILLGHSLGGDLATSYTAQYPDRVSHLILVDAWGFPERPPPQQQESGSSAASLLSFFNPLAAVRAAGPLGPGLVNMCLPDFGRMFADLFDDDTMTRYVYHCNAQSPSGELGFRAMCQSHSWTRRPMMQRVSLLPPQSPVSILNGSLSWVDSATGFRVVQSRGQSHARAIVIKGAPHHVYADQPEEFNFVVQRICNSVD